MESKIIPSEEWLKEEPSMLTKGLVRGIIKEAQRQAIEATAETAYPIEHALRKMLINSPELKVD